LRVVQRCRHYDGYSNVRIKEMQMTVRLAIYELAAEHQLDARALQRLEKLAGWQDPPDDLRVWLSRGMTVLAAVLGGLGLIFWVAANWDTLGRISQFTLLQGCVLAASVVALWRGAARAASGVLALLAIGGLLAYFGQTYQTGADPWRLFALWAALSLPLCLGVRSDVLWTPWALVTMSGVALWVRAHTGHQWRVQPGDLQVHLLGWTGAFVLVVALSAPLQRWSGAGVWAFRTAVTLAVITITLSALGGLFHSPIALHYALGLAILGAAAAVLVMSRGFEVYGLSAVALGLNLLLVAGLARLLFDSHASGDSIGQLLLLGLFAAGLLAASVALILRLSRSYGQARELA
jgi:uncharacterized membrane protein